MLNAGMFNKRIALEYKMENQVDEDGYPIKTEPQRLYFWAMVKPISAKEYTKERATQTENITRFVIRYRRDLYIQDDMRIFYKGRYFEIESVINDYEADETYTIIGKEVV